MYGQLSMGPGRQTFAETRHRPATRDQSQTTGQQTSEQRRDDWRANRDSRSSGTAQHWDRSQTQTVTAPQQETQRFDTSSRDRSNRDWQRYGTRSSANRSYSQSYDRRSSNDSYRRNDSYRPYRGSYDRAPIRNEARFYSGRVERYERYRGGFRVWIGGAPYPFFISANLWPRFDIRLGAVLSLGGYWDPLGYYNAYDPGRYAYATSGDIHGVVESVDYPVGTAVIRDDVSGAFVTVLLRGNDPRLGNLRSGDFVDLSGAWNRAGVFDAFNVLDLRYGDRGYDGYDGRPGY